MKNQEITLDEILNSELMNEMINQENKDLKEAGWTIEEVKSMANFIIKKQK